MSRVITFSQTFPKYHPKKRERTFFRDKIIHGVNLMGLGITETDLSMVRPNHYIQHVQSLPPKYTTIRAGNRWKVGDWFSPREWGDNINPKSGRRGPYQSKQITFLPDLQVKKVWPIIITPHGLGYALESPHLTGRLLSYLSIEETYEIAKNDGFDQFEDFINWFPKIFEGQIICWNENIEYLMPTK